MGQHSLSCHWWAEAIEVKKPSEICKLLRDARTLILLTDGTLFKPRVYGDNHHFSRFYPENRCFGEDPLRRSDILETFNGTRPDLKKRVVRLSFVGTMKMSLQILSLTNIQANTVPAGGNWYLCRFVLLSDWGKAKCNWGEWSDLLEDTCVCQKISLQKLL